MDLFNQKSLSDLPGTPLAEQLRPQSFSDFLGQENILQQLQTYLKGSFLPNIILWGPPGSGKTTLAKILSRQFASEFIELNAIETGAKLLKETGDTARLRRRVEQKKTLVFIDEIHRLNKAQQDVLLPFVEQGDFTLVGATTENPSYELNRALLSRCRLFVFDRLSQEHLAAVLRNAFHKQKVDLSLVLSAQDQERLIIWADGDARRLLTAIEAIQQWHINTPDKNSQLISWPEVEKIIGERPLAYDKNSDQHYDIISAFIKSVRGSDADAALYWLARMIKGGEDPIFIARRLVILASEDIGNADPRGIQVAVAAAQATEMIGLPEAGICLAQATTYLAKAPKSNRSYMGYKQALDYVEKSGSLPVPLRLRSSRTQAMKDIGYGQDYKYPHDEPQAWVAQSYSPENLSLPKFYEPKSSAFEKSMLEYEAWQQKKK